jgi:hypothetical protein
MPYYEKTPGRSDPPGVCAAIEELLVQPGSTVAATARIT